jgi:hypothetical protein
MNPALAGGVFYWLNCPMAIGSPQANIYNGGPMYGYIPITYRNYYCSRCHTKWATVIVTDRLHLGSSTVKCSLCGLLIETGFCEWPQLCAVDKQEYLFGEGKFVAWYWLLISGLVILLGIINRSISLVLFAVGFFAVYGAIVLSWRGFWVAISIMRYHWGKKPPKARGGT